MKWIEEASKQTDKWNEILSFEEFMGRLEKNPLTFIRTTALYFKDLFEYYGRDENDNFKLFQQSFPDSIPICGQHRAQKAIYENLINFCEEGFNNKFMLLVGPNGSSKTSIVKKLMLAAEAYSLTDEGTMYSFSWVFPVESQVKGTLGLGRDYSSPGLETFAHLDDVEISAILNSELKENPVLLIPKETRQILIDQYFENDKNRLDTLRKSYLYHGELSKKNQMIYDAMSKSYKGDHLAVLKHIRVERYNISRAHSSSAVTIEPQLHVDAKMQQITMDKRLAALPPSLQSLNLFQLQGEAVLANRGLLEFSDLLKRPLDAFKYLLMTMESKSINIQGMLIALDVLFMGTSNEIHLQAFKQHPDFNSFRGRMNFIRVPYLLSYTEEEKIYEDQIKNLDDRSTFEPYAIKALCLFAVLTRIRSSQEKHYKDKKIGKIIAHFNPLEKALYLGDTDLPERLNSDEKQTMTLSRDDVFAEYDHDPLYEGKFGISPREMKQIIYELSSEHKNITFIEVVEYLAKFIERKGEFEFLNISPQGNYHNPHYFIKAAKDYCLSHFDRELRSSLGLIDDRSYEDYIAKYITHISALIKGEKVKNDFTGKFETSDMYFIQEFENNIHLTEDAQTFRSHAISKLGAYALDNPGKKLIYTDVFPDIMRRLKESFREEQKKKIKKISKNLVYYEAEINGQAEKKSNIFTEENRQEIVNILENLKEKFNYTHDGALKQLRYTINEKY